MSANASLRCLIRSFNASASLLAAAILSGMSLSLFVFGMMMEMYSVEKKGSKFKNAKKREKGRKQMIPFNSNFELKATTTTTIIKRRQSR